MGPKKDGKKRAAAKGYKLPDPIPPGQILTDVIKNQWRMGKSIGQGGFGEIYLASDITNKDVSDDSNYVIKIEPHSNGPLFTEMHCYMRIGKPEYIENWKKENKLKHLGIPKYLGSGSHEYNGQKYRFMVMERFSEDLQKIIEKHSKMFSYKTVFQVVIQILDALEYLHKYEYIHADIKASNLLVGHRPGTQSFVYLVDYGLACRYTAAGKHKEYKYDQRRAHDGTIEFTSRDAHIGAHSRRGDLEILGYNLVQWLCGKLPWEDNLADCNYVANKKRALMDDIPKFMNICFPDGIPPGIQEYMEYVASLTFDETPNYGKCKVILREGLKRRGHKDDGKLIFMSATPKSAPRLKNGKKGGRKRRSEEAENIGQTPLKKKLPLTGRSPFKPRNFNNRFNTRMCPNNEGLGISLSRPCQPEFVVDPEEVLIEKENLKMLERQKHERPKRVVHKKDVSLSNPTPQMLEIMAKIREREKSVSPPVCAKRHRHNVNCQQNFWPVQTILETCADENSILTPAMEEVIRRRNRRTSTDSEYSTSSRSSSENVSMSSDMFDSDDDYEDDIDDTDDTDDSRNFSDNDTTIFYSPCGSTSPSVDCRTHDHNSVSAKKIYVRNYSTRRTSLTNVKRRSPAYGRKYQPEDGATSGGRVTRSSSRNYSPEIF